MSIFVNVAQYVIMALDKQKKRLLVTTSIAAILGGGVFTLLLWAFGVAFPRALYAGLGIATGTVLLQVVKFILQSRKLK